MALLSKTMYLTQCPFAKYLLFYARSIRPQASCMCAEFYNRISLYTMESQRPRSRSRRQSGTGKQTLERKRIVPSQSIDMATYLFALHLAGCPAVFVKLLYYLNIVHPTPEDDLVDSIEVFSGRVAYTKVALIHSASSWVRFESRVSGVASRGFRA